MTDWNKMILGNQFSKNTKFCKKGFLLISSSSTSLISLFYIFSASSLLQIPIFPIINRITFSTNFNSFVINENIDHVIIIGLFLIWIIVSIKYTKAKILAFISILALVIISQITNYQWIIESIIFSSLPIMVSLLFSNRFYKNFFMNHSLKITEKFLLFIGFILGMWSAVLVSIPLFYQSADQEFFPNHVYQIFLLLGGFIPFIMFILMFNYPVKIFFDKISQRLRIQKPDLIFKNNLRTKWKIIFLSSCILFSVFLSIVPHLDNVNPEKQIIGVDTHYYVEWIGFLKESSNSGEFFQQAFIVQKQGDRPFSLITFFVISQLNNGNLEQTIEYLPLLLSPALLLIMYFFTRVLTGNDTVSILSAFLTAVSFQTLGGMYAGFYANWLALILGIFSLIYLFKFLKYNKKINLLIFSLSFISVLFSHVYTWTFLTAVLVIFLLVIYGLKTYPRKNIMILFVIIFSIIITDVTKTAFTDSVGGIEKGIIFLNDEKKFSAESFSSIQSNLEFSTTTISGGQIGNFIFFMLSLYWLFVSDKRKTYNIFIMILFSIGLIPMIFSNSMMQTRLLYDISFQIPAALALTDIWQRSNSRLFLPVIAIWFFSFAVRNVYNFILKIPQ